MSVQTIDQAVNAARQAANTGRWEEAERLWRLVRDLDPKNPQALLALSVHASQRGDLKAALPLAEAACAASPRDLIARLMLARLFKDMGDGPGERAAIDAALAIDPYFVPGVLAKAAWMERHGSPGEAAFYYRAALKISPPEAHWPPALRPQLEHARRQSLAHGREMEGALLQALQQQVDGLPSAAAQRWREAISIRAGLSAPYLSQSNQFAVPRLPATPFFERDLFPWASAIEAKTDIIRDELTGLLKSGGEGFAPYVSYKPGEPMNQFAELHNSQRWSAFQLYKHGLRIEENCVRCPETLKALAAADLADVPGCPNVMFSALAPRTQIPPHQGESNARVVAHLPLIVPKGCSYRVGFERREWKVGQILVFDDTIEHEARNDSDELRVILIFDTWNPLLSREERDVAKALSVAAGRFGLGLSPSAA